MKNINWKFVLWNIVYILSLVGSFWVFGFIWENSPLVTDWNIHLKSCPSYFIWIPIMAFAIYCKFKAFDLGEENNDNHKNSA